MDEVQLILQLKKGDQYAFRQIVDTYQVKVLNTCLGFVPNRHDAEDLTQEVFIEVFRSIGNFREEAKLSTWIYRIAVRKSLELIRARKRKKRVSFFQSLIGLEDQVDRIETERFDHPGVLLENKERTKILYDAIARLPTNQKIAFTLHKIEDMSYKEIAAVMALSLSSVESLMFRAKKNLQKQLHTFYKAQQS